MEKKVYYAYRYESLAHPGTPLVICPRCQRSLTYPESVVVNVVYSASMEGSFNTQLDVRGRLADSRDGDIHEGRHSETCCGSCSEPLWDVSEEIVTEV